MPVASITPKARIVTVPKLEGKREVCIEREVRDVLKGKWKGKEEKIMEKPSP